MKKVVLKFLSLVIVLSPSSGCTLGKKKEVIKNFQKQLGVYIFDAKRTKLGVYEKDSNLLNSLSIVFKEDSTFTLNMQVPFIYDSCGSWIAGSSELDTWNYLSYKKNKNITTQFTSPWSTDSIFYLNSSTPKKGFDPIQEIYFRKISQ